MKTYTTDKEIQDMLTLAGDMLSPNETAFSKMLSSLNTKTVPLVSPYSTKKSSFLNYSFFSTSTLRIASGFAVFVFVLAGMISFRTKPSETTPSPEVASTQEIQNTPLAINNNSEVVKPSVVASTVNTQNKSTLAVASLKSSAAAPEAVDLQNALTNELNAEITAQADLLALSENI